MFGFVWCVCVCVLMFWCFDWRGTKKGKGVEKRGVNLRNHMQLFPRISRKKQLLYNIYIYIYIYIVYHIICIYYMYIIITKCIQVYTYIMFQPFHSFRH